MLLLCTFLKELIVEDGSMKRVVCVCLFAASTTVFAQGSYPLGDDQVRSEMSASELHTSRSNSRSDFGITTGFAGFKIDDIAREGVDIDLHALLARVSPIRFEFTAGVVLYNTPYEGGQGSMYSPYIYQSNVYGANQFDQPRGSINFGLGYIGGDALYYFSDGKIRPYIAAGVKAVTWQMSEGFAGTLSPSFRAGIEVSMSSSFSGFAEARYMYGFPNILNQYSSSLKYVTDVAFGCRSRHGCKYSVASLRSRCIVCSPVVNSGADFHSLDPNSLVPFPYYQEKSM